MTLYNRPSEGLLNLQTVIGPSPAWNETLRGKRASPSQTDLSREVNVNKLGAEVKAVYDTARTYNRIYFLDNIKILLAVFVVLDHAAQPYGPGGGWWIAPEPQSPLDFIVLGLFMGVIVSFFMGLFFMISAYFMPASLERKGAAKFMKDRLVKLGVPILIFMFGVLPTMSYLLDHYGQPVINFYVNYINIFSPKGDLNYGITWFLEVLLIFSVIYVAYWLVKKPSSKTTKKAFPGNAAILAFIVTMALMSFIVRIWAPENYWIPLGLFQPFQFEPFHIVSYGMLFAAGIVAYREGWIDAIPKATAKLWSGVAILMVPMLAVVALATNNHQFAGGLTVASLLGSFWEAFMGVSAIIALLAFFRDRFNTQSPFSKALAENTFTVYLLQLPVVVFLQYLLVGVHVEPLIKFAIVGTLGVLLSFAISHYVIRRLPYAKSILG